MLRCARDLGVKAGKIRTSGLRLAKAIEVFNFTRYGQPSNQDRLETD